MALAPVRLTLAAAAAVVAVGAGFTNVAPVAARRARPLLPRRWPDDRWRLRVARANDLSSGRDEERAYDECDPILTDTIGFGSDDDVVCSIENPYLETINEMDAEPSTVKKAIQGIGGYLTVLGGVLVQITMGSYYSWPSIMVYAPEHLRTPWMMTSTLLANLAFVPLLSPLILRLGPKRSCAVGSQLCALAVFLSSFFVNHSSGLAPFMALYGVAFGASMTMAYSTALPYGWAWFPNHRGVVSGFILGGFGAGSMIFNVVASNLANPDALSPIKGEFSSGVISRFPMVLRKLSFMYSLMAGLGCLMMREPAKITATWFPLYDPDGDKPSKEELKEKLVACLTSRRFITLCIMAWLAAAGGYTVANEYRTFGQAASVLRTDAHGRDLGVLCAVANGLGRPVWGVLVDNFGIAKPWLLLAIMQTGALGTFYAAATSRSLPLYYTATIVQFFCLGGGWAISSTACSRTFGDVANLVFSYVFLGFSFGSATGPALMNLAGFSLQQTLSFGANLAIISGILGMTYNVNFEGLLLRARAFLQGCHPDELEGNVCSIQNPYLETIDELGEDDAV